MKDLVMPKKMKVEGEVGITADNDNPVPVMLVDEKGNPYKAVGGGGIAFAGGGAKGTQDVRIQAHSGVGSGRKTITTAGTAEQLSSTSVPCKRVFIQALEGNTDAVVIGDSNVVASLASRRGKAFFPTQGDWFYVNDLSLLYIDSTANGDKVNFFYEN